MRDQVFASKSFLECARVGVIVDADIDLTKTVVATAGARTIEIGAWIPLNCNLYHHKHQEQLCNS